MAFLLDEDQALKAWFSGRSIPAERGSGTVNINVRFRFPEQENDRRFPLIALDLVDISDALDRNMRGRLNVSKLNYLPAGEPLNPVIPNMSFISDFPVPVNLDYRVETWTRSAWQDRSMQALVWSLCPSRFGVLRVANTDRTMQLLGSVNGDRIDADGKRTFRKIYTIRVVSELWMNQIKQVADLTRITFRLPVLWPIEVGAVVSEMDCNAEN